MRQCDGRTTAPASATSQERVAKLPRGHLHRKAVLLGRALHAGAPGHERQSEPLRGRAHEPFIRVTAAAAELVIEVGDGQFPTVFRCEFVEQVQQRHGIQPAGNRHEQPFATPEEFPVVESALNVFEQIAHGMMLTNGEARARAMEWRREARALGRSQT